MHPTAAFISMPNREGVITGGLTSRGLSDQTARVYPLQLGLLTPTRFIRFDKNILSTVQHVIPSEIPADEGCTGRCQKFLTSGTLIGFPSGAGSRKLSRIITQAGLVTALTPEGRMRLLKDQALPPASSAPWKNPV